MHSANLSFQFCTYPKTFYICQCLWHIALNSIVCLPVMKVMYNPGRKSKLCVEA